jgi:hypothetical protein
MGCFFGIVTVQFFGGTFERYIYFSTAVLVKGGIFVSLHLTLHYEHVILTCMVHLFDSSRLAGPSTLAAAAAGTQGNLALTTRTWEHPINRILYPLRSRLCEINIQGNIPSTAYFIHCVPGSVK